MAETAEVELRLVSLWRCLTKRWNTPILVSQSPASWLIFESAKIGGCIFDLKDETSSVKFFGVVYQLPGPLEEGMMPQSARQPRLHNLYGFSVNVLSMQPAGEGSIRRAADLLKAKLQTEGLFDPARKRQLPYPPSRIGLIHHNNRQPMLTS